MEKWTPLNSDIYGMVYVVKYAPCFQFSLSYYTISCLQHAYKGLNNDSKVSLLHNSFLLFQLLQNHLKCVRFIKQNIFVILFVGFPLFVHVPYWSSGLH